MESSDAQNEPEKLVSRGEGGLLVDLGLRLLGTKTFRFSRLLVSLVSLVSFSVIAIKPAVIGAPSFIYKRRFRSFSFWISCASYISQWRCCYFSWAPWLPGIMELGSSRQKLGTWFKSAANGLIKEGQTVERTYPRRQLRTSWTALGGIAEEDIAHIWTDGSHRASAVFG